MADPVQIVRQNVDESLAVALAVPSPRPPASAGIASVLPTAVRPKGESPSETPQDSAVADYFQAALQFIVEQAQVRTQAGGAAIALGDSTGMVCTASTGAAPGVGVHLSPGAGLSGHCLRTGEAVLCSDTHSDPRVDAVAAQSIGSIIILPVFSAGGMAALLQVMSPSRHAFGPREMVSLQQLARVLSSTIQNYQRFSPPATSEPAAPEEAGSQILAPTIAPESEPATLPPPVAATEAVELAVQEPSAAEIAVEPPRISIEPATGFFSRARLLGLVAALVIVSSVLGARWYVHRQRVLREEAAKAALLRKIASEPGPAAAATEPPASVISSQPAAPATKAAETEAPAATTGIANTKPSPAPKPAPVATSRSLVNRAKQMKIEDIAPLESRALAGDPEAQVVLGLAFAQGTLFKSDPAHAVSWYRRAAERAYVPAEEALGVAYQLGNGVPKDAAQALNWYTRAAQHGSAMAANELGVMYSSGAGVPRNFTEASKWFRLSAERGDATAQYNLARMYHSAQGVPANPSLEFQWLQKAARQGLAAAQFALALMYQEGVGVREDRAEAVRLLHQAANQGNRMAQTQLGYVYLKGLGAPVDFQQSLKWYRLAAEQGEPNAAYALSVRFFSGTQGVTKDYAEAGKWTRVAAQNGHPDAQYNLGVMYEEGVAIAVDFAEAAKWYARAADQGVGSAQLRLGAMYAGGKGVTRDVVAAYKWIALGQDDSKDASDRLRSLKNAMTPEQLAAAERAITDWRTAHDGPQQ